MSQKNHPFLSLGGVRPTGPIVRAKDDLGEIQKLIQKSREILFRKKKTTIKEKNLEDSKATVGELGEIQKLIQKNREP